MQCVSVLLVRCSAWTQNFGRGATRTAHRAHVRGTSRIPRSHTNPGDNQVPLSPRAGQTWLKQIVHLLRHLEDLREGRYSGREAPLDTPFIDLELPSGQLVAHLAEATPEPRALKTHLPFSVFRHCLSPKPKVKVIQVFKQVSQSQPGEGHLGEVTRSHTRTSSIVVHTSRQTILGKSTLVCAACIRRTHANTHFSPAVMPPVQTHTCTRTRTHTLRSFPSPKSRCCSITCTHAQTHIHRHMYTHHTHPHRPALTHCCIYE